MKKLIITIAAIIAMLNVTYVKALVTGTEDFFVRIYNEKGSLIPNGSYLYDYYWGEAVGDPEVTINYYNSKGELIGTDTPENDIESSNGYIKNNYQQGSNVYHGCIYKVDNSAAEVWALNNVTSDNRNITVDLIPFDIPEGSNIIYYAHKGWDAGDSQYINYLAKDGDIFIWFFPMNYSSPNFYYIDNNHIRKENQELNYLKVGYDMENFDRKIDDDSDAYNISGFASSGGTNITFSAFNRPQFKIECEKDAINKGENNSCILYVNSEYNIDYYTIEQSKYVNEKTELQPGENFELNYKNDKIVLYSKDYIENGEDESTFYDLQSAVLGESLDVELLKFTIDTDETISDNVIMDSLNIVYNIGPLASDNKSDYSMKLLNKEQENPNTKDKITFLIIMFISTALIITILNKLRNNKILRKI